MMSGLREDFAFAKASVDEGGESSIYRIRIVEGEEEVKQVWQLLYLKETLDNFFNTKFKNEVGGFWSKLFTN